MGWSDATDITGDGRKMGLNAGGNGEGKIDHPVYLGPNDGPDGGGQWMPAGTVVYRTLYPANGESSGGNGQAGNAWGSNRINNVSGSGQPQINDAAYPKG